MTLPTPPPLSQPIPNSTPTPNLRRADEPADPDPQIAGVHFVEGGVGLLVSGNTGKVKIVNTGVTSIAAGQGILIDNSTGKVTISAKSAGTVTSIAAGKGLSGGNIVTSGTISLATSGVTPGLYSLASISVDEFGRITAAVDGEALTGVTATMPIRVKEGQKPHISIDHATETHPGVVKISDSVQSNSSSVAASSHAVKTAFDAAARAVSYSCFSKRGDILVALTDRVPTALPLGRQGDVLSVDNSSASGVAWKSAPKGVSDTITVGDKVLVIEEGIITRII